MRLKTIILPVILCWWMGRLRLRVSENRLLRRIFGPKIKDAMEGWRKPYNEKLLDVYSSPNVFMMVTVIMKSGR